MLCTVVNELIDKKLLLEGLVFKPSMVTEGADHPNKSEPEQVAFFTVRTLGRTIPAAVPGITFLSGGQSEEQAYSNLSAINKIAVVKHPWNMSFSFGRALVNTVMYLWDGKDENVQKAQERLAQNVRNSSEAALGKYEGGSASAES